MHTYTTTSSANVLTISDTISTGGGSISATTQNPNDATALVDNGVLDTGPGTGGTLTVGGGVDLNATPNIGAGAITLQGNGEDLTLGSLTLTSNTNFSVLRNIIVTGALKTTSAGSGSNLGLFADNTNIGVGGVIVTSGGSINSSGSLTISGSLLTGYSGAAANTAVEIDGSIQAAVIFP